MAMAVAMEEDDERQKILAKHPHHLSSFDKEEFTADVVNAVMEISLNKFTEMTTYAVKLLKITSGESQEAITQGLAAVFEKFLSKFVEEDLAHWEAYCKNVCFQVPPDLVLSEKSNGSADSREDQDANLNAELNSLRGRSSAAEREKAELCRHIKSLEAHVEAKAGFMDAFDQLQNLPLVSDLGTGVRELRKCLEEASALRTQRYQRHLSADPSASGEIAQGTS